MKAAKILKNFGEKVANASIISPCYPWGSYQPKPPAQIMKKMQESK